jgi:hypothetical protein
MVAMAVLAPGSWRSGQGNPLLPHQELATMLHRGIIRFRALSAADRRTLLMCALLLPLVGVALRTVGLARIQARVQGSRVAAPSRMSPDEIKSLGELVNIAARHHPFPATCLSRSLLLQWLLHRRGIPSELRLGARVSDGTLFAHAWVELDGMPVNDEANVAGRFSTLKRPSPRHLG